MAVSTRGTWFGLPDYNLTEKLTGGRWGGSFLNNPINSTGLVGGSQNVLGSYTQAMSTPQTHSSPVNLNTATSSGGITRTTQSPSPTNNTSGGDVLGTNTNDTTNTGDQNTGPSLQQQIDEIFNPTFSYLNQAESNIRSQQPGAEQSILDQYGLSRGNLEADKTSGMNQLSQSEQSTINRKEDAASAARRLYGELQRGGIQRFGGASSAGQAYSELQGVEQQRQMGGIQQQFSEAMSKIDGYKNDLEVKFSQAIKELELQKNTALQDAQNYFQDKLLEITRLKGEAESNKAQMRLTELQNLRNIVNSINMQDYQYKQQLAANKQTSDSQVEQARQRAIQYATKGTNTYNQFTSNTTTNPTSNLAFGANSQPTTQQYIGQTTGAKKWDPNTGQWVE